MKELNFIKTLVSKENFKEREVVGNITFIRLDANEQENGMMLATECSVPTDELDESGLSIQYEAWKEKVQAAALEQAKKAKIAEIAAYDTSSAVNGFKLNGMLIPWSKDDPNSPNVDKRMGLRQNIADKIALGEENISIWLKGMSFTMPCAQAEVLMRSIENYAYECFNVTASHKASVSELTTIEEVEAYDYKTGYPKMLEMSV